MCGGFCSSFNYFTRSSFNYFTHPLTLGRIHTWQNLQREAVEISAGVICRSPTENLAVDNRQKTLADSVPESAGDVTVVESSEAVFWPTKAL